MLLYGPRYDFPIPLQVHRSELRLGTALRGAGPDPCGAAKGGGGEGGERLSIGIPGADAAAGRTAMDSGYPLVNIQKAIENGHL